MTKGEQVRDYIPVEQVAKIIISVIINNKNSSKTFKLKNIGSGTPVTLRKFAQKWWLKLGAKGKLLIGSIPYRKHEIMRYARSLND